MKDFTFYLLIVSQTVLVGTLIFLPFSLMIKMILIFTIFFYMVVELFNRGLKASIEHISIEKYPLAKIAKDVVSSATHLTLWLYGGIWVVAFSSLYL